MEKLPVRPSLNQLAEVLARRAGRNNDFAFREEMKVLIHIWRQRLLVDSLNSRPADREFFKIWMDLEVIDANVSDFPGFPADTCIKRTKDCLPEPVRANSTMFDFVGYLNKQKRIPLSQSLETIKVLSQSKFSGAIPRSFYMNGYIYTVNFTGPGISVAMIPEDTSKIPDASKQCLDCGTGGECYTDDKPYPVSGDIAQRIIQAILSTELSRLVNDPKTEEVPVANEQR